MKQVNGMGYVPPYIPNQNLIYGNRVQETYSSYKLQLHPVERIQYEDVTKKTSDQERYERRKVNAGQSFHKILSDLTGKGQKINEVI
ncbi:hypothetical protein ACSVDE_04500 [Pseudalkalibacillus sp. Hm43]|uniref:hypothetical protein n=1 Tax=Pseudalkalibacillus sp. Hm43 TaxID=3450742 RepID=UPI003F433F4B